MISFWQFLAEYAHAGPIRTLAFVYVENSESSIVYSKTFRILGLPIQKQCHGPQLGGV